MSLIQTKWLEDGAVTADKADSTIEKTANKGVANGYASLDVSGLVPASQLPSYVDDVLEFADLASFPGTGETGKIYVAIDTGKTYRWTGSVYAEVSAGPADTDALAEGATNLYFTNARVIAAPLTGFVAGADTPIAATDTILEAFEKTQGQINALASASTLANNVVLSLDSTDISNGYKDLAHEATTVLHVAPLGGLKQEVGVDYTLSVVSTVTRITFAGDLASLLADGDKLLVEYLY